MDKVLLNERLKEVREYRFEDNSSVYSTNEETLSNNSPLIEKLKQKRDSIINLCIKETSIYKK